MSKQKPATNKDAEAMLIGLGAKTQQRGSPAKPTRVSKPETNMQVSKQPSKPASKPAIKQASKQPSKPENNQESKQVAKPEILEERSVTFSTYLRPSLQKRVKFLALKLDKTTAAVVEEALEAFLTANE